MSYTVNKYPDGSQYVTVDKFYDHLVFKINSYNDLWTLRQLKDVYDHNNKELSITIPCLLEGQADRRFEINQSAGLKIIIDFLNNLNLKKVFIFHPHNPEVIENSLNNCFIEDNKWFIEQVLEEIENPILFSSDAGGFKPLMKLADKLQWKGDVYGASKSRKYEDGKSKLIQVIDKQDFQGRDILIVDDLMIGGGTFIGLAKMLKERNCGKLYLAVSHITVERPNEEVFKLYDKVFTTNSKFEDYFPIVNKDNTGAYKANNLEVIKMFC